MKVDVAQAYDDNDAFNNKWFISDYSRPEVGSGWWVASLFLTPVRRRRCGHVHTMARTLRSKAPRIGQSLIGTHQSRSSL